MARKISKAQLDSQTSTRVFDPWLSCLAPISEPATSRPQLTDGCGTPTLTHWLDVRHRHGIQYWGWGLGGLLGDLRVGVAR